MTKKQDVSQQLIHRDLSWLAFNERVLREAQDASNPLLERLKFLAIFVANMDEFFMVRVAGLRRLLDVQYNRRDAFGWHAFDLYQEIKSRTMRLTKELYAIYEEQCLPEMKGQGIWLKSYLDLSDDQEQFVKRYFETTLFPIMTPMAVDEGHPFPILPSKTLAFAMHLDRSGERHFAVLPVPRSIPRILVLPNDEGRDEFILIDDIIRQHLPAFFRGFDLIHCTRFRVMRDSEMSGSEEYGPDLLKAIEEEVKKRPKAKASYLEIEENCAEELAYELAEADQFNRDDMMPISSDFDLSFLFVLIGRVSKPDLSFPSYTPAKIPYDNIFDHIRDKDFMSHMPYQSFFPTLDLIESAAKDPNVLAIKMTLYRTNDDSAIIDALKKAAQRGKQVSVLVEIKARFDEEQNINWARELEQAGCHVMYGILGMKIHSKIALVVRKEESRIRRYVYLSTGNFNEKTAKIYTDIGLFTADYQLTRDVSEVFNVISGYSMPSRWQHLIAAPNDMRPYFFELIDQEIEHQQKFGTGSIFAKMNSLEDPAIIHKLYEASQAGVKIRLLVRGICALIPGKKGVSENIQVRSIVGRFLEHSRIYVFNNNQAPRVFVASADWMRRNFDRRIELLFEMKEDEIIEELLHLMDLHWQDNQKTWFLNPDGTYQRLVNDQEPFSIQSYLIDYYQK